MNLKQACFCGEWFCSYNCMVRFFSSAMYPILQLSPHEIWCRLPPSYVIEDNSPNISRITTWDNRRSIWYNLHSGFLILISFNFQFLSWYTIKNHSFRIRCKSFKVFKNTHDILNILLKISVRRITSLNTKAWIFFHQNSTAWFSMFWQTF